MGSSRPIKFGKFIGIEGLGLDDTQLLKKRFDIIINATSAGHKNSEMPIHEDFLEDAICYVSLTVQRLASFDGQKPAARRDQLMVWGC